jgi:aspartyl-tRNA(Asn)/glutamyl-tRNA(Gln) amidotransferase subunit A
VGDLALMLTVLAEPDVRDPYLMPYDPTDFTEGLERGVEGLRIAYSPTFGGHAVHPEIAAGLEEAAQLFAEMGAIVERPELEPADTRETFKPFWFGGAAYLFRSFTDAQIALVDPGLQEVVAEGRTFEPADFFDATKAREAFCIWMARLHRDYDLLLLPNMPLPAFDAGHEVPPGSGLQRWTDWTPYSIPFNLTGQPAGCMPSGLTADGLPMSIQLVGARYDDATVLRAMAAYERAKPMALPPMAREPQVA